MSEVKMISVVSANVDSIGYNENTQTLYIKFSNGATYSYINVPPTEFEQLKSASSVGSYLNRNIKGYYPYHRIS